MTSSLPSPENMIRVAIVDDQPMVRAGFEALLKAQPDIDVRATCADGTEAVQAAVREDLDVILMDIRMPIMDGLTAMEQIFARPVQHQPKIIILTTFDADDYVFTALRGGASGFLLKDAEVDELVNAVRTVHRGGALLSPAVTRRVIEDFSGAARGSHRPDPNLEAAVETLTEREKEVVRLIAKGLSNAEVGAAIFLAEPTIKTHVSHVLQKLGLRDRTQIVVAAYESGLVQVGEA